MSDFQATETMWDFMNSDQYVRVIAGSVGSGKSVACCHELVKLAMQQEPNAKGQRKSRALVTRNTADQLTKTTRKTFFAWFPPGVWGTWKESEKTYYIRQPLADGTTLDFEIWFMPLDTPQDVQRALSLEITFLYGNEWRELHPTVIDGLLARLKRYPSGPDGTPTRSCAIFDTNMPDIDSWHFDKMENPPSNWSIHVQPPAILNREEWVHKYDEEPNEEDGIEGNDGDIWYVDPNADNVVNLDPSYYADIIPGKSEDYTNVYLRCCYGRSLSGLPVYDKTFDANYHLSEDELIPLRSTEHPIIIGLDYGRTPACVLLQRNVHGQIFLLGEATSENMGIETFLETKLRPLLAQPRFQGCTYLVAPDPAGWAKQQIGEVSPTDIVKQAGFAVVKPVTNNPEQRVRAVERALSLNFGGRPGVLVDPSCVTLIQGFKYGYRYKLNKQGIQDVKPDKNSFSHCFVGDTLISTPAGAVQIADLSVGDMVYTSTGTKRVTATMNRVVEETIVLEFSNGSTVRCTKDHPMKTTSGIVLADALHYEDLVIIESTSSWQKWAENQKTPGLSTVESPTTSPRVATTSIISNSFRYLPTWCITLTSGCVRATRRYLTGLKLRRMLRNSGTHLMRVENGTGTMPSGQSLPMYQKSWHNAYNVAKNILATLERRSAVFVRLRANRRHGELPGSTMNSERVLGVAQSSPPTNTKKPLAVAVLVARNYIVEPVRVYDLTIADDHEFYADGVLVGNCHDAAQYAFLVAEANTLAGSDYGRVKRREVGRVKYAWT